MEKISGRKNKFMSKITPKQYARAIYQIAEQDNITTEIIKNLGEIERALNQSSLFYKFLVYPKSTIAEKEKKLAELFENKFSHKTYRVILLLAKNRDLKNLNKVIVELEIINKEEKKILDVNVYTPLPIDQIQKIKLNKILANKTAKYTNVNEIIKPELIGGIKIDIDGLIIDGTIAGKIKELARRIKNI